MKHLILYALILLTTPISFAQSSCQEVFSSDSFFSSKEKTLFTEFEIIMSDLSHSVKLSTANANIHRLTVSANEILDHAMDLIIQVNYMNLPKPIKEQQIHRAQVIIEQLQQTFDIGNNAMTVGIKNRLDIEVAELLEKSEAQNSRKAIGFGRDELYKDFHAEVSERKAIGFGRDELYKDFHAEVSEKQALGFRINREEVIDSTVTEIVDYEEAPSKRTPIGFIHPKTTSSDLKIIKKFPIGFIHFKPQSERISLDRLDSIIFDIRNGTFELKKAKL